MKIGLYFGTFNPIHVGHLIIANHMANYTDLDQVWMVVSPQNPLKQKDSLLADYHRLAMVRVATEENNLLKASNVEFELPKPSYTANTLAHLKEENPENEFVLIMGEDNLRTFHKWKNCEQIIAEHSLFVYPRLATAGEPLQPGEYANHPKVKLFDVPVMNLSSSFIRKSIKEGKDVRYLLSHQVYEYLTEMHFYKK